MIRIGLSAITGRGRRWSLPVSTLAVAILATFSPCLAEDWEISFVDGPKWFDSMRDRSLCIDRQGHPHVIYWHAGGIRSTATLVRLVGWERLAHRTG